MGWAAIFTVIFLSSNTYYVYHSFSVFASPYREIASAGVALIVAASMLIYTLRKNFRVAKYYTIFEVSISAYYYINTIGWDWGLIPALGFTLILPISVYYYSREFDSESEDWKVKYDRLCERWNETVIDHKRDIEERNHYMQLAQTLTNDFANQNKSFEELVLKNIDLDKLNQKWMTEFLDSENSISKYKQELAHWIDKYQNEVQESATQLGLRDERIGELEALVDQINSSRTERDIEIIKLEKECNNYIIQIQDIKHDFERFQEGSLHETSLLIADHENEVDKLKQEIKVLNEKQEQPANGAHNTEHSPSIEHEGVVNAVKTILERKGSTPIAPTAFEKTKAPIKRKKKRV